MTRVPCPSRAGRPTDERSGRRRVCGEGGAEHQGWYIKRRSDLYPPLVGNHGFDNSEPDMKGAFIAQGPGVATGGVILPDFEAVDVYNYLAALLGVTGAPNNGSSTSVLLQRGLRNPLTTRTAARMWPL